MALYPYLSLLAADSKTERHERLSSVNETIPQVIFGGEWTTRITFVNTRGTAVGFPLQFYGTSGQMLNVPLVGISPVASTYTVSIPAGGQVTVETAYAPGNPTVTGSGYADVPCQVQPDDACGRVAGIITLRNRNSTRPDFEAVSSLRSGTKLALLPFDNSVGHQTVIMLTSDTRFSTLTITAAIRNSAGERVHLDQFTIAPRGTMLFNLAEKWPQSSAIRGTVEFTSPNYGLIVTALRLNPSNSFASIEAFEY